MLEVSKNTVVAARINRIRALVTKEKKTRDDALQLIEKDIPWLLSAIGAHHTVLRKLLLLASGGGGKMKVYDIHTINNKLMDAALLLFQPTKEELARIENEVKVAAAAKAAEDKRRDKNMAKLEKQLIDGIKVKRNRKKRT